RRVDRPNAVARLLGKPEVAVGADRNGTRRTAAAEGNGGDGVRDRIQHADPIITPGEPEVAVRAGGDRERGAAGGQGELVDRGGGGGEDFHPGNQCPGGTEVGGRAGRGTQ